MKRLSLILPMYNVEPYIERCIRSLEEQDMLADEYEVICINDGSPDNCSEVVIRLQKEFNNIILVDQENKGVSVARNNGIEKASGKYLMMIDPDDYIQPNTLKEKLDILELFDPDFALTSFIILDKTLLEEYRFDPVIDTDEVLGGIKLMTLLRNERSGIDERDPGRSWACFMKRSFLKSNGLRYLPDVPYLEDSNFMGKVYCLANRGIFINKPFYIRTTRPGSATHSGLYHSEKARNGFLKSAYDLLQFQEDFCRNDAQKDFINGYIIHFTIIYLNSNLSFKYLKHYTELYNSLKKGPLKELNTGGCSGLYKKMANYYNYSIHCFYFNWLIYIFKKWIEIKVK